MAAALKQVAQTTLKVAELLGKGLRYLVENLIKLVIFLLKSVVLSAGATLLAIAALVFLLGRWSKKDDDE